nr:sel1 repeat family protein [Rhizobium sp. Q54]
MASEGHVFRRQPHLASRGLFLTLIGLLCWTLLPLQEAYGQTPIPTAEDGRAAGYLRLAQMYTEGKAVHRDLERGLFYYRHAEKAGSDQARLALGMLAYKMEGSGLDKTKALASLHELAAEGQVSAHLFLADIHAGTYGDRPDPARALKALQAAADQGSVQALIQIGNYYREGEFVPYSAEKAIAAYRRAEAAGSGTAAEELALFQAYGEGMEADPGAAMARLEAAKKGGRASAWVTEGDLRLRVGIPAVDIEGALGAWSNAATRGRNDALLRLGDFYFNGYYGRQRSQKALALYEAAAKSGDPLAQLALAKVRLSQRATAKTGLQQLERLAQAGFEEAGVAAANAYLRGVGVRQDVEGGLRRLEKMAGSGSVIAGLRLVEIYRNGLHDGYGTLVQPDKKKAADILRKFRPSLGSSSALYQGLLLDAATGRLSDASILSEKLDSLPLSLRHRLLKDLRGDVPDLYFGLIRRKLMEHGYMSADQDGWKPTVRAMMSYCRDRGVEKICASGPFAPRTAEALQALM